MININIEDCLKSGRLKELVIDKSSISAFTQKFGEHSEVQELEDGGQFVFWDNLRVKFDAQGIYCFGDIFFNKKKIKYGKYQISPFSGELTFSNKLSISKLLIYLNFNKIQFSIKNSDVDSDILKIVVGESIDIIFRLDPVKFDRISFVMQ